MTDVTDVLEGKWRAGVEGKGGGGHLVCSHVPSMWFCSFCVKLKKKKFLLIMFY